MTPIKLLLIEDNDDHALLIMDSINEAFTNESITTIWEKTLQGGRKALQEDKYDALLLDLSLPDSHLNDTLNVSWIQDLPVPIIVLTSLNDIDFAKNALSKGVQDFLPKSDLTSSAVLRTILYAIERKRLETSLQEKNNELETFSYALAHDFNGPIRRISNLSEWIVEDFSAEMNDKMKDRLGKIQAECTRLQTLVADLDSFLCLDNPQETMKMVELEKVLQKVVALSEFFREREVDFDIAALPMVYGIENKLFILFKILLENAVKYNDKKPHIKVTSQNKGDAYWILVEDNGIGIEERFFRNIFEPFRRLHPYHRYKGSGLGLPSAKKIVDQHRGKIWLESDPGKGTTFFVSLPADKPEHD